MLNPAVIGRLSDGYIQPINNWLLGSVLGRPSSSVNTDFAHKFDYLFFDPVDDDALANGFNDVRWVSAVCCPDLTNLHIGFNKISIIHLSGSIAITELIVNNNPYLKVLDVSTNIAVSNFFCDHDPLEILILPPSKASYQFFYCNDCQLTSLDLDGAINLSQLYCQNNSQLTLLNISGAFTSGATSNINCSYCQLSTLEFTSPINLVGVLCNDNLLTTLDLTGVMGIVNCSNNLLTSLISPDGVTNLNASNCHLSEDDEGGVNYILTRLDVGGNPAGTLDISGGTNAVPTIGINYDGLAASSSLASKTNWVIKRNY